MKTITLIAAFTASIVLYACLKNKTIYKIDESHHYDVVIVGGGISGLTAAYNLKDYDILVLEKENVCGGRVIKGEWEGFYYPKGMEYIGPPEKDYTTLFNELGISIIKVPPPTDGVLYQGNIFTRNNILNYLPDQNAKDDYYRLMSDLKTLSDETEDAIWENQEDLAKFANLDAISVEDWLKQNNYHPLIQEFVDVENRGLFGASNKDLSLLFNLDEMSYDLPDSSEYNESEVYTFTNGMFEYIQAIINKLNNKIQTGAEVVMVQTNNDMGVTIKYIQNGETHYVTADCVIMATPAPITAKIVTKGLSNNVINTLKSIKYSKYITVNLFTTERIYKDSWMVSCIDEYFVTLYDAIRTQVNDSYNGKSILGIYIAPKNANDSSFMSYSDNQILDSIYIGLENYFPDIRNKVIDYDIQRFDYAFPVFEKDYSNVILTLQDDDSAWGPIFLCGDYMMYATFDGAFWSSIDAAEEVIKYIKDE
ncbi:MAG: hypothetical protein Kow0068_18260 [Marinilabiliales bacterium]